MLNLISNGDLDTGLVKRYLCDTLADFAEIPRVAKGSTVLVQSTGEVYKIDAEGNWKYDSCIGNAGTGGVSPSELARAIENYFSQNTPAALNERFVQIEDSIRMQNLDATIGTL